MYLVTLSRLDLASLIESIGKRRSDQRKERLLRRLQGVVGDLTTCTIIKFAQRYLSHAIYDRVR